MRLAAVVAEAGPRLGLCLPPSIGDVRQEPDKRRPLVEACLWPWPAEWPGDHPWGSLPSCAITPQGEDRTFSLTLENRGDAPVRGEYRLKVVPASAARFEGPRRLAVNLKPGARTQLEVTLVATGQSKAFCFAAEARGVHLSDSRLFCVVVRGVPPTLTIQRIGAQVQLTWNRGALQEASEVTGPWTAVADAFSPELLQPTAARKFYRTMY